MGQAKVMECGGWKRQSVGFLPSESSVLTEKPPPAPVCLSLQHKACQRAPTNSCPSERAFVDTVQMIVTCATDKQMCSVEGLV